MPNKLSLLFGVLVDFLRIRENKEKKERGGSRDLAGF
jgi:hypothetical protein